MTSMDHLIHSSPYRRDEPDLRTMDPSFAVPLHHQPPFSSHSPVDGGGYGYHRGSYAPGLGGHTPGFWEGASRPSFGQSAPPYATHFHSPLEQNPGYDWYNSISPSSSGADSLPAMRAPLSRTTSRYSIDTPISPTPGSSNISTMLSSRTGSVSDGVKFEAEDCTPSPTSPAGSERISIGNDSGRHYPCQHCGKSFKRDSTKSRHESEVHMVTFFVCPDCNNLRRRVHGSFGVPRFQCCFCPQMDPDATHYVDEHYACVARIDLVRLPRAKDFEAHIEMHSEHGIDRDYWCVDLQSPKSLMCCDLCGEVYQNLAEFKKHRDQEKRLPRNTLLTDAHLDARITTAISGLLNYQGIQRLWLSYIESRRLPREIATTLKWSVRHNAASEVLKRLERVDPRAGLNTDEMRPIFDMALSSGCRTLPVPFS